MYLLTDQDAIAWVDRERLPKVAAAFARILGTLDGVAKKDIARVDSLGYLALEGLHDAVEQDAVEQDDPGFCDACFSGAYPTAVPGSMAPPTTSTTQNPVPIAVK